MRDKDIGTRLGLAPEGELEPPVGLGFEPELEPELEYCALIISAACSASP